MKAAWDKKPLGDVAEIVGGGTPSKSNPEFFGGNIPWATVRDMNVEVLSSTEHTITELGLANSSAKIAPRGEVIIATRVGLGKVCLLAQDTAINQDLRVVVPRAGTNINRRFLYYWFKSIENDIVTAGTGATVQGVKLPFVKSLRLPLPPVEEQQRIVAILDEAFEGLDRAKANAEANLASAGELFEALLADAFCPTKKEWEECALNDHVNFIDYRGKTPPKTEKGVRLITAKNVKMGYIQQHPEEFILESAYEGWMTRGFPAAGDVLFTTEAPLANVAQLDTDETVVIGQRLITMQADPDVIVPEFLKFALMSPPMQREIHSRGTGATVIGIKAKLLKTVPLRFPRDLADQWNVAERCRNAYAEKQRLEAEYQSKLDGINELRQSLLAKAFAGELT